MDRTKARAKAEALVAQMTVEEKITQLRYDAPAIERLGVHAENTMSRRHCGSFRCCTHQADADRN